MTRVEAVRDSLERSGLEALVLTKGENVRYLSGFTGDSGFAVITEDNATLITDGRFREQAERELGGWEIIIYQKDLAEAIASCLTGVSRVGLEDSATLAFHGRLVGALDSTEIEITDALVEDLRVRKDPQEIEAIRSAIACALSAWESLLPMVQPGVTERQLAAGLDYRMLTAGADKPAFDTIVASGPNASMPHAGITDRVLQQGDQIIIDFGAMKDGYNCDITRTVTVGEPDGRAAQIANAVRGAWDAAFKMVKPGAAAADVDAAARDYLEEAGFADAFVHSLGHGVGLEVHEKPSLSRLSKETLEPGMVFTIEPGIYLEGEAGARHEEMVWLTHDGPVIISTVDPTGAHG